MNRREFLTGAAGVAAAAVVPGVALAAPAPNVTKFATVVITGEYAQLIESTKYVLEECNVEAMVRADIAERLAADIDQRLFA